MNIKIYFNGLTMLFGLLVVLVACGETDDANLELPPVDEAFMEVNGGGSAFPNAVFIKLRGEEQLAIRRDSWDLAFSSGNDGRVLINGTTGAMASATDQTNMAQVGNALADELRASGRLDMSFTNMNSVLHVDNPANPIVNGNILGVAAANEQAAKVFIINRGASGVPARPWKKVKIYQSSNSFFVQHADVTSTTFVTAEIKKNADFNFVYFSFEQGVVEVEPKKADWDIMWSAGTSTTPFPQAVNGTLAYYFQDLVHHNIYGGVTVAQVMESNIPFANFKLADVQGLQLVDNNRLQIGSSWRSGGGPNAAPSIRNDRYYIIKDRSSNHYKLRFLSLTTNGERGRPSLEYALIKE